MWLFIPSLLRPINERPSGTCGAREFDLILGPRLYSSVSLTQAFVLRPSDSRKSLWRPCFCDPSSVREPEVESVRSCRLSAMRAYRLCPPQKGSVLDIRDERGETENERYSPLIALVFRRRQVLLLLLQRHSIPNALAVPVARALVSNCTRDAGVLRGCWLESGRSQARPF